eukprot:SAG11_NODE_33824_length_275_cov_0.590909_2_plen_63_part_01
MLRNTEPDSMMQALFDIQLLSSWTTPTPRCADANAPTPTTPLPDALRRRPPPVPSRRAPRRYL